MVIFGELVHPLLFYPPLSRVYFVAKNENIAMRSIVIFQLFVPIRAQVLKLMQKYLVTLGIGDVKAEDQSVAVAVDAGSN